MSAGVSSIPYHIEYDERKSLRSQLHVKAQSCEKQKSTATNIWTGIFTTEFQPLQINNARLSIMHYCIAPIDPENDNAIVLPDPDLPPNPDMAIYDYYKTKNGKAKYTLKQLENLILSISKQQEKIVYF